MPGRNQVPESPEFRLRRIAKHHSHHLPPPPLLIRATNRPTDLCGPSHGQSTKSNPLPLGLALFLHPLQPFPRQSDLLPPSTQQYQQQQHTGSSMSTALLNLSSPVSAPAPVMARTPSGFQTKLLPIIQANIARGDDDLPTPKERPVSTAVVGTLQQLGSIRGMQTNANDAQFDSTTPRLTLMSTKHHSEPQRQMMGMGPFNPIFTAALKTVLEREGSMSEDAATKQLWQHRHQMRVVLPELAKHHNERHPEDQTVVVEHAETTAQPIPYDHTTELILAEGGDVRGGTLRALVERLLAHGVADPDFLFVFLLTYRSFTTGQELLSSLKSRFLTAIAMRQEPDKIGPIELRVVNVLRQWLENYFHDFEDDDDLMAELVSLIADVIGTQHPLAKYTELSGMLTKIVRRKLNKEEKRVKESEAQDLPKPVIDKKLSRRLLQPMMGDEELSILEFEPLEVSRQMTLISSNLFRAVQPKELLNSNWTKKGSAKLSPNIHAITRRFNILSMWVQREALSSKDVKVRAQTLSKMIQIAHYCFELQNFNDAKAMVAATQSAPLYRLRKTWEKVKEKEMKWISEIDVALSSERSYRLCREKLANLAPPCVPYLGMFLSDLVFIEDGNKDFVKGFDNIINFDKRRKIAAVIRKIQQLQQDRYKFEKVHKLSSMLATLEFPNDNEEEMYQLSLVREPRVDSNQPSAN
eukprot:c8299_g1_i1.p1 GENE.c8299_g1_i1~~c8299_g1_i1.p1  ORF type:complete len:696 (-),score=177.61 c8299_g1_i1:27-2114(-)